MYFILNLPKVDNGGDFKACTPDLSESVCE